MASTFSFLQNRTRSTFITSLFVISLVLFFLGLFTGMAVFMKRELEKVQQEFEFMIYLPDHTTEDGRQNFETWLKGRPYVKSMQYISKDGAAQKFREIYGDASMELMGGTNPLPASYNIQLNLAWIQTDSIRNIEAQLLAQQHTPIMDTDYPIDRIEQLKANLSKFIRFSWIAGLIVLLVAFFIVNSTVRLAIYSKRLMIRSMQLIGATNGFIRRPFLRLGILQGALGGVVADGLLLGLVVLANRLGMGLPTVAEVLGRTDFLLLLGGIIIFGALIGWLSSLWAVSRFLNKNLDQLM